MYIVKRKLPKHNSKLLTGVTAASLALLSIIAGTAIFRGEKVIEVMDGDTYRIQNKQVMRLYGVDAPELGTCMSEKSKNKLSTLILGKRVTLRNIRSGGFNRVMGYTYLGNTSIETEMMKAGMVVLIRGTKDLPGLMEASDYARSHQLGVFSPECYQTTNIKTPACNIKGNVGETKSDKHYFTPSCPNYTQTVVWLSYGDQWFCSEKEAINAGFIKGTKCK